MERVIFTNELTVSSSQTFQGLLRKTVYRDY